MASRLDDAPLRADHRRMVIATTSARVEAWRTSRPVAMSHSLDGVWNLRACPQKRISCLHQTNPKQPTLPWRMVRRSFVNSTPESPGGTQGLPSAGGVQPGSSPGNIPIGPGKLFGTNS
jgi:hypothetical protein